MIPARMGSNVVEDVFSELGGWHMNKRVYTLLAATETLTTKLKIKAINAMSGMKAERQNRRLLTQWDDVPKQGETFADLGAFPSNDELEEAWRQGEAEGRMHATQMDMSPDVPHPEWWTNPERMEGYVNEEDNELDEDDSSSGTDEIEDGPWGDDDDDGHRSGTSANPVAEENQAFEDAAVSIMGVLNAQSDNIHPKIWAPTVERYIHKAAVMKHLSDGTKISTDRVMRYRSGKRQVQLTIGSVYVGLGTDVAIMVEVSRGNTMTMKVYPARIVRTRKALGGTEANPTGWIDYKQPFDLGEPRGIWVHAYFYKAVNNHPMYYEFNAADPGVYPASSILCVLEMNVPDTVTGWQQVSTEQETNMRKCERDYLEKEIRSIGNDTNQSKSKKVPRKRGKDATEQCGTTRTEERDVSVVFGDEIQGAISDEESVGENDVQSKLWVFVKVSQSRVQFLQRCEDGSGLWEVTKMTGKNDMKIRKTWKNIKFNLTGTALVIISV